MSIRNDIITGIIYILLLMLCVSCVIYPHELRKAIIEPTYDEWESGHSETSPEIIMSQLDDFDESKKLTYTIDTIDFEYVPDLYYGSDPGTPSGGAIVDMDKDFKWWRDTFIIVDSETGWIHGGHSTFSKPKIERDYSIGIDTVVHMSDLIKYQTECYNDSTLVQASIPYDCGQPFCLVIHPEAKYVEYWLHREPTFTGFIQWLKSKKIGLY